MTNFSRTQLHRQITEGDVLVNQALSKANYRVRAGDTIEIELPSPPLTTLVPESIPLDIIYEDNDLVVINKPAGIIVHPAAGIEHGTLANGLVAHFAHLSPGSSPLRPGIVHRLDRDTSGLLVVAKNEPTHQHLCAQFAARTIQKHYVALVYGRLKDRQGKIDLPIGRHPSQRAKMAVNNKQGRNALTLYKVRKQWADVALLDIEIKTGRTHQIRVHLAHINHPIVADEVYNNGRVNNIKEPILKRALLNLNRQFLHAARLVFTHPTLNKVQEFTAPLPLELTELLSIIDRDSN